MAKHKFDGEWKYYGVDDANYPPDAPDQDGTMTLRIEDDGHGSGVIDKTKSKHKKVGDLTGDATDSRIRMTEKDGVDIDIIYEGNLIPSDKSLILVGTWKNNGDSLALRKKRKFTDGQNDGTWVMTKP